MRGTHARSGTERAFALPTREEINPYDDLDGRWACEHFYGKSIEQARELIRENPLCYQEAFVFMGPVAFRFYIDSAIAYLQQDSAIGAYDDLVPCFAGILELRLQHEPQELAPIAPKLSAICGWVADALLKTEYSPWPYHRLLPDKYTALKAAFLDLANPLGGDRQLSNRKD